VTSFNIVTYNWTDPKAKHTVNYQFTLDHANKLLRQAAKGFEALNAERAAREEEPYTYYLTLVTDKTDLTAFDFSIPNVRVIPMWQDFRSLGRCFTKLKLFSKKVSMRVLCLPGRSPLRGTVRGDTPYPR